MQFYWGQKGVSAVTGIAMGFDDLAGSTFSGPFVVGDIGYYFIVTNTTTALPTPGGWNIVSSGTLASGGKYAIYRRAMQPADTFAHLSSTVSVVSGASGIWGGMLGFFRATKNGTPTVESEAVNNNVASTLVAVPASTSTRAYVLTVAMAFIDFEQSLDTIVPSRNEYTARGDTRGVNANTLPTPYFLCGAPQNKAADSWNATASVASVVATVAISEAATSGMAIKSSVEGKSIKIVPVPTGNSNINLKSSIEGRPLKGSQADVDRLNGSQSYGGGVQIL